jgi:radical SAM superfamily enzyme YgiQ (UPF0313 family)
VSASVIFYFHLFPEIKYVVSVNLMKVVLVQPPIQDFYDTDIRLQPIGLCYLKAAIKKYLPDVDIIVRDYHSGHGRRTVSIPQELSYLVEYYPVADRSPFSAFHQYYHFGQSFGKIENELAYMKPDVVGISSLFTPYYQEALQVARLVKRRLNVPVIMGGSHVSAVPESALADPSVDFVIRGEGEKPFVEFMNYLLGRRRIEDVPNLGYKKGESLCFNHMEDNYHIDSLPYPDLSDLSLKQYELAGSPLAFMFTSRGCPHTCSFCSVHLTFGKKYRSRAVHNIIEEIEERYKEGYRLIDFEDDNLTFYKDKFKELCRQIIKIFPDGEMKFTAMNGISYVSIDDELLELMFQAGFSQLNLSLVSLDNNVQDTFSRPHDPGIYEKIVNNAFRLGFRMVSYQILGLPDETLESMVQTLAFQSRLPVLLGVSPFYLTPNAPVAAGMHFKDENYKKARLTAMAGESGFFKREDIYTMFISSRIINFLKGLDIPQSIDLSELIDHQWSDKRIAIGFDLLNELKMTGILYFHTSQGRVANRKFRADLFYQVLSQAKGITCQNGKQIFVS